MIPEPEHKPDFLVGLKEISRVTGFSPWEVRQMLRSGMLPGIRVGRSWVAAKTWLEAWKSARQPRLRPGLDGFRPPNED